jgi:hypothetical protein
MIHSDTDYSGQPDHCCKGWGVVDCGFEPWLGQTKDYKIGICWFFNYAHSIKELKQRLFGSESG